MTIQTLFGTEEITNKSKVKIRQIKSVFTTVTVKEEVTSYLDLETRYTDPAQVFSLFSFLQQETKEYFIALHLDGSYKVLIRYLFQVRRQSWLAMEILKHRKQRRHLSNK